MVQVIHFKAFSILNHVLQRSATPSGTSDTTTSLSQSLVVRLFRASPRCLFHVNPPFSCWHPLAPPSPGRRTQAASLSSPFMTWGSPWERGVFVLKRSNYTNGRISLRYPIPHSMSFSIETCSSNQVLCTWFQTTFATLQIGTWSQKLGNWYLASVKPGSSLGGLFRNFGSDASNNRAQGAWDTQC